VFPEHSLSDNKASDLAEPVGDEKRI